MDTWQDVFRIALVGFGATAVMDVWLQLLKCLGVATQGFGLIGRWVGHLLRGRVAHASIAKAEPVAGELLWGWLTHYAVGVLFAGLLVFAAGHTWLVSPTLLPALAAGVLTVAAPLLIMQPSMGAGFFASKTPSPARSCTRSLLNHTVFGLGLYLSASLVAFVQP